VVWDEVDIKVLVPASISLKTLEVNIYPESIANKQVFTYLFVNILIITCRIWVHFIIPSLLSWNLLILLYSLYMIIINSSAVWINNVYMNIDSLEWGKDEKLKWRRCVYTFTCAWETENKKMTTCTLIDVESGVREDFLQLCKCNYLIWHEVWSYYIH